MLALLLVVTGCVQYQPKPLDPARTATEFDQRSLSNAALKAFLEHTSGRPCDAWPMKAWDLDHIVLVALFFHPDLELLRAQQGTAESGVLNAAGRPNPVITLAPGISQNPTAGVSPWFPLTSLDLPIETAGKRARRIDAAKLTAEGARLRVIAAAWTARGRVRDALIERAASVRRSRLLEVQLTLQREAIARFEQRRLAGAVAANEQTPIRLALAKTESEAAEARRLAAVADARLAEALGLPLRALSGIIVDWDLPAEPQEHKELSSDAARSQALQGRADILAALADYAATEAALRLEIARQYPDIHLNPGYQFDQGEHKWSVGLSVELPLLNRNQGPIAEAESRRAESAARFLALQAKVVSEIDTALTSLNATIEQCRHQDTLQTLIRQRVASLEAQVKAGAADQSELIDARIEAALGDLSILDAVSKAEQALAQLELAVQQPLGAWPPPPASSNRKDTP